MEEQVYHVPVMLMPAVDQLAIREDGLYVDGTLGGGGHTREILRRLGPKGRLIAVDQDEEAIRLAGEEIKDPRLSVIHDNFEHIPMILAQRQEKANGILLDLGVSSHQLDSAERGFSYRFDAPLDMRMDRTGTLDAGVIVNTFSEQEIKTILWEYGEERYAPQIAKAVIRRRETAPIKTTGELVDLIRSAVPKKALAGPGHPAKRTFQAIRIAVNRELDVLEYSLDGLVDSLADGGRLSIITFHSLEDRIVKQAFKRMEHPCTCPPSFPVCVCGKISKGKVITRKPVLPTEEEEENNPRAKSAKLRAFERIIL